MNRFVITFILFCGFFNQSKAARENDSLLIAAEAESISAKYIKQNQLDSAIYYKEKALSAYCHVYEKSDTLLTDCMYELACLHIDAQHYRDAISLLEEVEKLQKTYNLYDADSYSLVLAHLSLSYAYIESYPFAIKYCEELLTLKKNNEDEVGFSYIEILGYLVNYYIADDKIHEALEKALYALNLLNNTPSVEDIIKISTLHDIANCYSKLLDIQSAIRYQSEAIDLSQDLLLKDKKQGIEAYYTSLYGFADLYADMSNYQEAIRIMNKCIAFCEENMKENDHRYAQALLILARYNSDTGYYSYAAQLCKKAYDIHLKKWGEYDQYTLLTQLQYAKYLACTGNYLDAKSYGEDAVRKYSKVYEDNSYHMATVLSRLADIYAMMGNYEMAIEKMLSCITICKSLSRVDTDMQYALASYYISTGNYLGAVNVCKLALENERNGHVEKLLFHVLLTEAYYHLNDITSAKEHIHSYMNYSKESYANKFTELPYSSKKHYWDYYGGKMRKLLPLIASTAKDQETINFTYDFSALWYKGLMYRADLDFRNAVYKTNDHDIINDYLLLNSKKNELFRSIGNREKECQKDSLENHIQELEMRILSKIKFEMHETCSWQDIQRNLKNNELAIEFVSYPVAGGEMYLALTLKSGFVGPKCYELFIDSNDGDISRFKNLWNIIKEDISGVNRIYFSPTGIINNLGIEYFPIGDKPNISDFFNVYRVSSTSQLVESTEYNRTTAVLYGDLNYDMEMTPREKHETSYPFISTISRSLQDSLINRSNFDPLYHTKEEIKAITQVLKGNKVVVEEYTGNKGTEDSFRNLSGKNINIMHIATHGMYVEQNSSRKDFVSAFSFIHDAENQYESFDEDIQMNHSFLVLSGGNLLPQHKTLQDGKDDGILTAQEISLLDFRHIDIVTLSACQTALGVITTDGVLGLQRAFKKAGANTILMTLDKVDDEATKLLMVEFYRNLMSGKTKRQSLQEAQQYLRKVENGKYDDPKYWASFIMLDGIN